MNASNIMEFILRRVFQHINNNLRRLKLIMDKQVKYGTLNTGLKSKIYVKYSRTTPLFCNQTIKNSF